jgi:predicted  nucleic acid-binding Zn-ribbon protein
MLYAAGICLAAFVGAVAIVSSGEARPSGALAAAPRPPLWRRKSHIIAALEAELATTAGELEEHRRALANLAAQHERESHAARLNAEQLEGRIHRLEAERDRLQKLVADERERFDQTLEELGGGIGRHGTELAQLERELEALIAR